MDVEFIELPAFERMRDRYMNEQEFRELQNTLMSNPECGVVIPGTGGLRKMRFGDKRRNKGKRGGIRVIYYWWRPGLQFWLASIYDKDEMSDLSASQRKTLKILLHNEISERKINEKN